jgi:hypothetical protein
MPNESIYGIKIAPKNVGCRVLSATEVSKQTIARIARGVNNVDTGSPAFILNTVENHGRKTVAVIGHIRLGND